MLALLLQMGLALIEDIATMEKLLPAEGELVLDVVRIIRIVGQLFARMLLQTELRRVYPQRLHPLEPLVSPVVKPCCIGTRLHEELHLHLLEFPRPEDEVARRDLVAKRFADLRYAEWDLLT